MATLQDLEREVAKLRKQVRRLQRDPNAANQMQVDELTASGEENHERQKPPDPDSTNSLSRFAKRIDTLEE